MVALGYQLANFALHPTGGDGWCVRAVVLKPRPRAGAYFRCSCGPRRN
jgi:hypothetical protein